MPSAGYEVSLKRNSAVSSAERPHLQLHDSEVISFWEATVVEGVAGAAATQIQILIHPQTKVTTAGRKRQRVVKKEKSLFFPLFVTYAESIPGRMKSLKLNAEEEMVKKKKHYLPPPMAKESKSPLIKNEFSPVHLKHCREKAKVTHAVPQWLLQSNLREFNDISTFHKR